MVLRQQVGAVLAGGSLLAGAASAVPDLSAHGVPERATKAILSAVAHAPCRFDPRTLFGMAAVESGFGTSGGNHLDPVTGVASGAIVSSANARGPLQFIPPTWAVYATDGDGDGVADIDDIDDSSAAAANLLCASNIDENWEDAVGSYNGGAGWRGYAESTNYVAQVRERMAALPPLDGLPAVGPSPSGPGAPFGAPGGDRYDGVAMRIADRVVGQALDGFAVLNGRAQEKKAQAPELANFFTVVDDRRRLYTDPATGQLPTAPQPVGATGSVSRSASMVCPVAGPVEHRPDFGDPRSGGRSHQGNDIFAAAGTPVVAPFDGVVTDATNDDVGLGGISVWITADGGPLDGYQVYLAHNAKNVAIRGQRVKAGQVVAYVGSTGNASADSPHVHAQVHPAGGPPVDPWPFVSAACASNKKVIP